MLKTSLEFYLMVRDMLSAMTVAGVIVKKMIIRNYQMEVTFDNNTSSIEQPMIEFNMHNSNNLNQLDIYCYSSVSKTLISPSISFVINEKMTNSDITGVFMTFLDIEKFKPGKPIEVAAPAPKQANKVKKFI